MRVAVDAIHRELEQHDVSGLAVRVVNATESIRDSEPPVAALRQKPDASVLVAIRLVKEGQADAALNMGHTGAVMVSANEFRHYRVCRRQEDAARQ